MPRDPDKPKTELEKLAAKHAKKEWGYTRSESNAADKANRNARIRNEKEAEIDKMKAAKKANYDYDTRYISTGADVGRAVSGFVPK